jgi:gluconokinase
MIGTSGAMRVAFAGEPPKKFPAVCGVTALTANELSSAAHSRTAAALSLAERQFSPKSIDDDHTEEEIENALPDRHGLTFLPFLAGERSTGYHETASGAVLGLKSSTDTIDIVQAALESVAYRFAEIFDQLNDVCKMREIIASGGALRESPVWTQIICRRSESKYEFARRARSLFARRGFARARNDWQNREHRKNRNAERSRV